MIMLGFELSLFSKPMRQNKVRQASGDWSAKRTSSGTMQASSGTIPQYSGAFALHGRWRIRYVRAIEDSVRRPSSVSLASSDLGFGVWPWQGVRFRAECRGPLQDGAH